MKNLALLSMLSATALTFTPAPAKADSEGAAAVGGFIGGLIVGQIFNDRDDHRSHRGPTVSVEVSNRYHDRYDRHDHGHGRDRDRGHDRGYWDTVRVKVWVPGYWTTRYERGRKVRCHVEGRYEWRTERVWVSGPPSRGYSSHSYSYRR